MKILLRNWGSSHYVWKTAKYNNGYFMVEGCKVKQCDIVSVMNDNRKNYVQCSSCGQVFRRNDPKFEEHKKKAITPLTCLTCPHLEADDCGYEKRVIEMTKKGEFIEKFERQIEPVCGKTGGWWGSHSSILSDDAISGCKKRQCGNATELEIVDFFTEYPGAFDCIATIDSALDEGYNVYVTNANGESFDIKWDVDWTVGIYINHLGIIDRCYVWVNGDKYWVYYSKKYNKLFYVDEHYKYIPWWHRRINEETQNAITEIIAKLYR